MRRTELDLIEGSANDKSFALQELGSALRSFYGSAVIEPLPEKFRLLLEQLDAEATHPNDNTRSHFSDSMLSKLHA